MSSNPFIKPLKSFNPKTDLNVNESFRSYGIDAMSDALSDLESEGPGTTAGKEYCSIKTGGAINAGLVAIENESNKTIMLVANKKGEIIFLTPEAGSFKTLSKFRIQGSIIRKPAYSDGVIYCTTREGLIYAIHANISPDSGNSKPKVLWQKKLKKGILSEPVSTGKILIVASLGGIYGFEAYYRDSSNKSIGRPLWKQQLNGVVSSPNIHSGIIYIGSEDKNLYAFDYGGSKISKSWSYELSGAVRVKPCVSEQKDYVLAPTIDGFIYCLDRRNGEYKWSFVVKAPVLSNVVSNVDNNRECFYFGADNGIFYCIDSFGKKLWSFKTNGKIRTEAVVSNERVYFGSEDNNFYALNKNNGKLIFKFSTDGNINSRAIVKNGLIFFGSTDSFVHGVNGE